MGLLLLMGNRDPGLILPGAVLVADMATPNLLRYSEQFDNAVWTKLRGTISANAVLAPDGTLTADKITEDTTASSVHQIHQNVSYLTGGGTFTLVAYLKAAERTWAWLNINAGPDNRAWFDLTNGVVGSVTAGVSSSIQSAGNGWYRCSMTFTVGASGTGTTGVVGTALGDNAAFHTGDGTSGIYVWGAMLNEGSTPLPYVKTTDLQTITDLSGNGNTLTLGNSAGIDNADPARNASWVTLGGVDDYLISQNTAILDPSQDFTVGVVGWVDNRTANRDLFAQQDGTGAGRTLLGTLAATGEFVSFLGGVESLGSGFTPNINTWFFGALSVRSGQYQFYCDGVVRGSGGVVGEAASGKLVFGANKTLTTFMPGREAFAFAYQRGLSNSELAAYYSTIKSHLAAKATPVVIP